MTLADYGDAVLRPLLFQEPFSDRDDGRLELSTCQGLSVFIEAGTWQYTFPGRKDGCCVLDEGHMSWTLDQPSLWITLFGRGSRGQRGVGRNRAME